MSERKTSTDTSGDLTIDKIEPGQAESGFFQGIGTVQQAAVETPGLIRDLGVADDPVAADPAVLSAFWGAVRRLPAYVRLVAAMARDPRVPPQAKASLAVGGVYAVSPIDLIPGVIPVAGQIDDLYVLLTAIQIAVRLSPDEVVGEHLERVGLQASSIDDDLATIRRLVRVAIASSIKFGSRFVTRMASGATSRIRTTIAQRRGITDEQKSI